MLQRWMLLHLSLIKRQRRMGIEKRQQRSMPMLLMKLLLVMGMTMSATNRRRTATT